MSERYVVEDGSASKHCCFGATVVDTKGQALNVFGEPIKDWFPTVCECFTRAEADKVAAALNLVDP